MRGTFFTKPATAALFALASFTGAQAALVFATTAWPLTHLGGEFMPQINEGDLLYMPSALPGLSAAKAGELLQQTDRLIKTVPEVQSVFGKALTLLSVGDRTIEAVDPVLSQFHAVGTSGFSRG